MPNQRSKDKIYLGGFIDKDVLARITRQARREGITTNKFGFVTQLLEEALGRRLKKLSRQDARPRRKSLTTRNSARRSGPKLHRR